MPRARHRNTSSKTQPAASTRPLDRWITPALSKEVIKLVLRRGWTLGRIQTIIEADAEFLRRVQAGAQSFSARDVKLISKALRLDPMRLLFEALQPIARKTASGEMYNSTARLLKASDAFREAMQSPTIKKRRANSKAA